MFKGDLFIYEWSNSRGETNSSIFIIEVGVEGFNEAVSQNEGLSELRWKVQAQNTDNALWFSSLVYFKNVVFSLQSVGISFDDKVKSGEVGDSGAVDLLLLSSSESFGHVLYNFGGANQNWCSSINNTENVANFVAGSVEDDIIDSNTPIVSSFETVVFERTGVVFGVDATEHQGWAVWASDPCQVEREGISFDLPLLDQQVKDQR